MAKKSKRRSKQAKRRVERRAAREGSGAEVSAADRLLTRIHLEAQARRDRNVHALRLEEARAWRSKQRRRARGSDDLNSNGWDDEE